MKKNQKVFPYVKVRDEMIKQIIEMVKKVYPDDKRMLQGVIELTVELKIAQPAPVFVSDLLGFIVWANGKKENASKVLTTVIHDLSEFSRNRNENWFCPRSSNYRKYFPVAAEL